MSDEKSCSQRFNAFHLAVAILTGRMGWLLEKLIKDEITDDGPGLELLQQIHSELESLIDQQDCREHSAPALEAVSSASPGH